MGWHTKVSGGYSIGTDEATDNAQEIRSILVSERGWSLNAVCGLLGNISAESGMNPWRWQSDAVGNSDGSPWTSKGYGLTQFTPASKYINSSYAQSYEGYGPNFSDKTGNINDGNAQIIFVDEHADYYAVDAYPLKYEEFKKSTESPSYLAGAWLYNYERPADPFGSIKIRQSNAEKWWEILNGTPFPVITGKKKLFLYLKPKYKYFYGG